MQLTDVIAAHQAATERNASGEVAGIEKAYLKFLEHDPANPHVLQLLGTLYMQTGRNALGIQLLERCVSIDPNIDEAWNNLGNAYRNDLHADKAEKCFRKSCKVKPTNPENWNNWGTNYVNEGRAKAGEKILRHAVALRPEHPHANWNLSLVLLEQGKYEEGFARYRHGLNARIRMERFYGCPEWNGEPTDHLIVYAEQGIGDEIMYCSMLPMITTAKKITVDCHPRLIGMLKRSFPHIEFHPTRKDPVIDWARDHNFTAKICMGDLGRIFIKKASDFIRKPYIKTEYKPEKIIGISWEGGKKKTRADLRSLDLDDFLPIIKARPDYRWVSLQYTTTAKEQVEAFNAKHGTNVEHAPEAHAYDYDETLKLASKMRLVVTVNTSLVHLCGAAGIPAIVLTPYGKAWRYYSPGRNRMAMYGKHITLIQQDKSGDWTPVIEKAKEYVTALQ